MVDRNILSFFNDTYDATNQKVLKFITAKCANTADISDIFQETYMEFYSVLVKRGASYVENSEALVMKLAKQKIYRHYSFTDRFKNSVPLAEDDDGNESNVVNSEAADTSFESAVCDEILVSKIREALLLKPQITQKIFYLYYSLDTPIPEIAQLLSVNESYVKNKLYRTVKELRSAYMGKDDENHE